MKQTLNISHLVPGNENHVCSVLSNKHRTEIKDVHIYEKDGEKYVEYDV